MKSVVSQRFWNQSYKELSFSPLEKDNIITNFIGKYIKNFSSKKVFEIGCFPGGYLEYFGKKDGIISGIDLTPRTHELTKWFKSNNISVGKIYKGDILKFKSKEKYDIVCSFGFIEHFHDWKKIIDIHDSLLKKNGYMIITCPNFNSPINWTYHKLLDWNNLSKHDIQSMNYKKWAKYLESKKYEVMFHGSFGKTQFWFDTRINNKFISDMRDKLTIWLNKNAIKIPILNKSFAINAVIVKKI